MGLVAGAAGLVHHLAAKSPSRSVVEDVDWRCLLTLYTPVLALILVSLFFYWSSQRLMSKKLIYNRSMQHLQVNFDLFTKFLLVVGIWWLFHALAALLQRTALTYISMAFNIIIGPLVFLVAMCRTRVAFLFKRYFCFDECCCCCAILLPKGATSGINGGNFNNEEDCEDEFIQGGECQELATIDMLKERADRAQERTDLPPPDPDAPLGRVRRLLKSNSLTALANINFG